MRCPFCNEDDFDLIGLKWHLLFWCEVFNNTPSIEEEVKDEKKNIPEEVVDYPCGSGIGPCNDCGLREECDERCKTTNTEGRG